MNNEPKACLVCGEDLEYLDKPKTFNCERCGKEFVSNACCVQGHYICDACHEMDSLQAAELITADITSTNPIEILNRFMNLPQTHMHGPEHHALIPVALLIAYYNSAGLPGKEGAVEEALRRGREVPGGICGFWGTCGAAIGTGIFLSIVLGATPLKQEHYGMVNRMTSESLAVISRVGGPRCCKRNGYLSISKAISFVDKELGVSMERPEKIVCEHASRNKECTEACCPFYSTTKAC